MEVLGGLIAIAAGYLIGSIPCGILAGKANNVDIRKHGSGNIGATNVRRVLGKQWSVFCFVCDFAKGFVPVMVCLSFASGLVPALVALACIAGHVWPVYLRFKGGKGVATSAGAVIPLAPLAVLVAVIVWGALFGVTRIVSVASLAAAVVLPATGWILYATGNGRVALPAALLLLLIGALVIFRHRANIVRLARGQEHRVQSKGGKH